MSSKIKKPHNEGKTSIFKNSLLIGSITAGILSVICFSIYQNKFKSDEKLRYWSIALRDFNDYAPSLRSIDRVFSRMNYEFVIPTNDGDWDILWSLEFPWDENAVDEKFRDIKNKKLLPHQKVNHFPGIFSLVSKSIMSDINRDFDFILPSFLLPDEQEDFDKFIKENPQKKLLQKNLYNRGVKIIKVKDINPKLEQVFYQEFMDNPFLIDGHAFDFGVFVLITSFDPIRVYRFDSDVLLRFCPAKYHPFDPKNPDKYVVKDGSTHVMEMPSFEELYKNYSYSSKNMFEDLILKNGHDVNSFWARIDNAIAKIVLNSEKDVRKTLKNLTFSSHHFFELVRFDIILDAELNPFVVEVNMSPNLTPSQKSHEENALIHEQVVYNVVKMIGGSSYHEFYSRFDSTSTIVSNRKNLATSLTKCLKYDCINNCNRTYCQLCHPCMTDEVRYQLSEAFREHQHAANFKRVFPVSDHFNDEKLIEKMTKKNQIQMRWWKGKCENDERWC